MNTQPEQIGTITPTEATRLGRMLTGGRLTATLLSKRSQQHVTLTMESMSKVEGKWQHVPFAEASNVFIKMGQGGYGSAKLATYYPRSGKLFFDTPDKAWRYAVIETLRAAVTGQQDTPVYTVTESNRCGCCGLELTNDTSIKLGIGPTCEEKYLGTATARTKHYTRDEANLVETLDPAVHHQRQVARSVLATNDVMNAVLGGPSREEAQAILDKKGRSVPRTFEALAAAVNA